MGFTSSLGFSSSSTEGGSLQRGSLKGSFKGSIRMTIRGSGSRVQGFFLSGSGFSDSGAFGVSSSVYGSTSRLEASKP